MSSNAFRDLARIQNLHHSKQDLYRKQKEEEDDRVNRMNNLMRFVVFTLKKHKNQEMFSDEIEEKIKKKYNNEGIRKLIAMKVKTFFKMMQQKQLIISRLNESGHRRIIKLIDFDDESELNHKINDKIAFNKHDQHKKWYDKHDKEIINLSKWTVEILENKNNKQIGIETMNEKMNEKFGKSLRDVFDVENIMDIWKYLENEKKLIVIKTTLDKTYSFLKLNVNSDDIDIKEPPLKKRKLNQYINNYNDGKIDESKMTEKIVSKLTKLATRHEIHFYFQLTKPSLDDDMTDSEIEESD